jgi:hypothetical protein
MPQNLILGRRPEENLDELDTSASYLPPAYARFMAGTLEDFTVPPNDLAPWMTDLLEIRMHQDFGGALDAVFHRWFDQLHACQARQCCLSINYPAGFEHLPNQATGCPCRDFCALVKALADPRTREHTMERIAAWKIREEAREAYAQKELERGRLCEPNRDLQAAGLEPKPPLPFIERNSYRLVRVDGTESTVHWKPTLERLQRDLDCSDLDNIVLSAGLAMLVDDSGLLKRKPVNARATGLVKLAQGADYPYAIHGDAAVVNDADF